MVEEQSKGLKQSIANDRERKNIVAPHSNSFHFNLPDKKNLLNLGETPILTLEMCFV